MRNNAIRIGLVVFFILLTGYYLYPSVRYYFLDRKLDAMTDEQRTAYLAEGENFQKVRGLKEEALNLGLDLQGGMHVTMEVGVQALIRALATENDATLEAALADAQRASATSDEPFVDLFVAAFEARDPDARLSRYFRNDASGLGRSASNAQVAAYLNQEANDAVDRAVEIVRQRVDRFGVTEPSIVKQGTRRIVVELPGIDEPERVRRLLRGTARLEFRLMADPQALQRSLGDIIAYYDRSGAAPGDTVAAAPADSAAVAPGDTTLDLTNLATPPDEEVKNPILRYLNAYPQASVVFGTVAIADTAALNRALFTPDVQALLPAGVELMYEARPVAGGDAINILGVRKNVELTGDVITEASVDFDETNRAEVIMNMNPEGARTWARLTGANINKQIAIVLDGVVYSYPNVLGRISGGRSSITGLDSREEASDVVTILKSGSLPAPVNIIEERTVGPSLGAESIRAGLRSLIIGLTLVVIFMIVYYRTAGVLADIALLVNVIFILGILAGFNATLTLPGMAGIVLTIGMAVDANVLIFERVREEMAHGRTLRAAVDAGYSKAFSAILDANVTTFFTGLILYSFGVGPIKGFAVTLMAGILASLFSAIVITRILFDWLVEDRKALVSIG